MILPLSFSQSYAKLNNIVWILQYSRLPRSLLFLCMYKRLRGISRLTIFFIPYDARKVIDKINTFLKAILWLLSLLYMEAIASHLTRPFIFPFQMCVRMKIALNLYSPLNILLIWPLLLITTTTATCYTALHFCVRCLNLRECRAALEMQRRYHQRRKLFMYNSPVLHVSKSRLLCCIFLIIWTCGMRKIEYLKTIFHHIHYSNLLTIFIILRTI